MSDNENERYDPGCGILQVTGPYTSETVRTYLRPDGSQFATVAKVDVDESGKSTERPAELLDDVIRRNTMSEDDLVTKAPLEGIVPVVFPAVPVHTVWISDDLKTWMCERIFLTAKEAVSAFNTEKHHHMGCAQVDENNRTVREFPYKEE